MSLYYCIMDPEKLLEKIRLLEEENDTLKEQLQKLKNVQKAYYENNKDTVIEKANQRLKKLSEENPDKLKEYRRTAYQNRKEKKLKEYEINNT